MNRVQRFSAVLIPLLVLLTASCTPLVVRWVPTSAGFEGPAMPESPRSILFVPDTDPIAAEADYSVTIETSISSRKPPLAIRREYLVPTLPWTSPRRSLSMNDETVESALRRLDDVALPLKMVALDGQYPGDAGYPLISWSVLALETESPGLGRGSIRNPKRRDRLVVRLEVMLAAAAAEALESDMAKNPPPRLTHVAAVGDIMPGRGFDALLLGENGIERALGDVAPLLASPDLLIGNLETTVTDSVDATAKSYNFKVAPEVLPALRDLGFDFFHLANNHGWDYGKDGFLDTLREVRRSGLGFSGAGENLDDARRAWETEGSDGSALRILSLGAYFTERNGFDGATAAAAGVGKPGVLWDSPENEEFIRSVLDRTDAFTIVTVHGGYEWEDIPRDDVMRRYRRYVDWGADLVLAHHPHVLQGMESYHGALIAYSLGNFIFPGMSGWYTGEETGILDVRTHDGRIVGVDFLPVMIDDTRLRRAESDGIAERFWTMSEELTKR